MLTKRVCFGTAAAVLSLGFLAGTSHAAPAVTGPSAARAGAAAVESIAFRRCWIEDGVHHCRLVPEPYDNGLGYGDEGYYDDDPDFRY